MQTAPDNSAPDSAELRKQLILAQVQIMELEDLRDELHTRLAATHALRIESAQRELQEECTRLRTSLREAREQSVGLVAHLNQAQESLAERDRTLGDIHGVLATLRNRIEQLEAERLAMKASRSWRWTAPLRSIERLFLRRGGRAA
jgi:hypothetical protein